MLPRCCFVDTTLLLRYCFVVTSLLLRCFVFSRLKAIPSILADATFNCDNTFEGAGWLQVRYVRYASSAPRWFQSRDGLRGSDEYGLINDAEFSIYYKNLLKPDNEMLFVIGSRKFCLLLFSFASSFSFSFSHAPVSHFLLQDPFG
jgi:hypothetical protein